MEHVPLKAEFFMEQSPICRLCTMEIDVNEVAYIYETNDHDELTLADKINACLPITVSQMDNLPKQICSSCKEQLECTFAFSQSVTSAQEIIMSLQFRSSSTSQKINCPLCCCGCMDDIPSKADVTAFYKNGINSSENGKEENTERNLCEVILCEESLNTKTISMENKENAMMLNQDKKLKGFANTRKRKSVKKGYSEVYQDAYFSTEKMECSICSTKLRDVSHALVHALSAHSDNTYETFPCPLCQKVLSSEKELTDHIHSHNFLKEIDTIRCCLCESPDLRLHVFEIHSHFYEKHMSPPMETSYCCPVCEHTTEQLSELFTHLIAFHSNEKDPYFLCPVCALSLFDQEKFKQHMTDAHITVNKSIRCKVCGVLTDCPEANVKHLIQEHCPVETHTVPSFYTCFACSTNYPTQYQLLKHWCPVVLDNLICKTCNKSFLTKSRLVLHMQTHQPDLFTMECHTCFLVLKDEDSFYNHVRFYHEPKNHSECQVCKKVFKTKDSLRIHMKRHLTDRTHQCTECGKGFHSAQTLHDHRIVHLPAKPFQCRVCSAVFSRIARLRVHMRMHANRSELRVATYKCLVCSQLFPNTKMASDHCPTHKHLKNVNFDELMLNYVFRCEFCDACFEKNSDVKIHCSLNHPNPNADDAYKCIVCGAHFSTYAKVNTHKLSHGTPSKSLISSNSQRENKENESFTIPRYFSCDDCDMKSLNYTYMSYHRRFRHSNGKQIFECEFCKKKFATSWSYTHHRKKFKHNGDDEHVQETVKDKNLFFCSKCKKPYTREADLKLHESKCKIGQSGALFICEICGKTFNLLRTLEAHRDAHRGLKRHKCDKCGRRFTHRPNLVRHVRLHSAVDAIACEYCDRRFRDNTERDNHRRSHIGLRPFMCEVCGRTFHTRNVWLKHSRMHQGIRPYVCDICGRSFSKLSSLESHNLIHTGQRPFECPVCQKKFRLKRALHQHEKREHRSKAKPAVNDNGEISPKNIANNLPEIQEQVKVSEDCLGSGKKCSEEIRVVTGSLWPGIDITKQKMSWKSNLGASLSKSSDGILFNIDGGQLPNEQDLGLLLGNGDCFT